MLFNTPALRKCGFLLPLLSLTSCALAMEQGNRNDTVSTPGSVFLQCADGTLELSEEQANRFQMLKDLSQDCVDQDNPADLSKQTFCTPKLIEKLLSFKNTLDYDQFEHIDNQDLCTLFNIADFLGAERPIIRGLAHALQARGLKLDESQQEVLNDVLRPITIEDLAQANVPLTDCIEEEVDEDTSSRKRLRFSMDTVPGLESLDGIEKVFSQKIRDEINEIVIESLFLESLNCEKLTELFTSLESIIVRNCTVEMVILSSKNIRHLDLKNNHIKKFHFPSNHGLPKYCKVHLSENKLSQDQFQVLKQFYQPSIFERIRRRRSVENAFMSFVCIIGISGLSFGGSFGVKEWFESGRISSLVQSLFVGPIVATIYGSIMGLLVLVLDETKDDAELCNEVEIESQKKPSWGWKNLLRYGL